MKTLIASFILIFLTVSIHAQEWQVMNTPNAGNSKNMLRSIHGVSGEEIWAVGHYNNSVNDPMNLVLHYNGSEWSIQDAPNPGEDWNDLFGVAAVSSDEAWAVGVYNPPAGASQMEILEWDGSGWSLHDSPTIQGGSSLWAVTALGEELWAVGNRAPDPSGAGPNLALTMHYDGSSWEIVDVPWVGARKNRLVAVDGIASDDVWAVGHFGNNFGEFKYLAMHWDGNSWQHHEILNTQIIGELVDVKMLASDDVWAVGTMLTGGSRTFHWDGSSWSEVESQATAGAIAPLNSQDIWFLGTAIHHYNGNEWIPAGALENLSNPNISDAVVLSDGQIFAAGRSASGGGGALQNLVVYFDGSTVTGIYDEFPKDNEYNLHNFPDPLPGNSTTVQFNLDRAADVRVNIYNLTGQLVHTQNYGSFSNGNNNLKLDLSGLHTGTYIYTLSINNKPAATEQLTIL